MADRVPRMSRHESRPSHPINSFPACPLSSQTSSDLKRCLGGPASMTYQQRMR